MDKKARLAAFQAELNALMARYGVSIQLLKGGEDFELAQPTFAYVLNPNWQPPANTMQQLQDIVAEAGAQATEEALDAYVAAIKEAAKD